MKMESSVPDYNIESDILEVSSDSSDRKKIKLLKRRISELERKLEEEKDKKGKVIQFPASRVS